MYQPRQRPVLQPLSLASNLKEQVLSLNTYEKNLLKKELPKNPQQQLYKEKQLYQLKIDTRDWISSRGKQSLLTFSKHERKTLKRYFQNMDNDGSGMIGLEELQNPFISLGLVDNIGQVRQLFEKIDKNKNGTIEFEEFVRVIRNSMSSKDQANPINQQFRKLLNGKFLPSEKLNQLSFKMQISHVRRQKIMDALTSSDKHKAEIGKRIMANFTDFLKHQS